MGWDGHKRRREERMTGEVRSRAGPGMTGGREEQRQMGRWTGGEGPLTAVSKQDGRALPVERAMMTQRARQLCPFYYWADSFIDRAPLLSLSISLTPPVQLRAVELCRILRFKHRKQNWARAPTSHVLSFKMQEGGILGHYMCSCEIQLNLFQRHIIILSITAGGPGASTQ